MGKKVPKKKTPKRRAWRKNDIEDVEEAVEDERLVAKMKRKPDKNTAKPDALDEELFTVDTTGSGEGLTKRARREIARAKIFPPKGPKLGFSAYEEAKIERARNPLEAKGRKSAPGGPEVFDLWAPQPKPKDALPETESFRLRTLKKDVKMPRNIGQKVGVAPAVLPAHEGQSLNPDENAYEDVACLAAGKQLEREREVEEVTKRMRPVSSAIWDHAGEAVKEMDDEAKLELFRKLACPSAGEADAQGEEGEGALAKPVKNKQKSQAQRNREKARVKTDVKQAQLRTQKKLERSVGEVGAILKDMKSKDDFYQGRREYRQNVLANARELEAKKGIVPKKRRLGRTRFVEEDVVVPEAGCGEKGMRAAKLTGNVIQDRVASIVRRGMVVAPPDISKQYSNRLKKGLRLKKRRKFISPLLRDNLMLR